MEASGSSQGTSVEGKREIDIGRILSETFRTYGENLVPLLGSAAAIFLIAGAIRGLLFENGGILLGFLAALVLVAAQMLYAGFVVKLVEDVRDGRRDFSVGELISAGAAKILPLAVLAIIVGVLVTIGFVFLFLPGLFLLTIWFVSAPAVVIEDEAPLGAMGRSWNLVKGNGFEVFGVIVVTVLIVIGIWLVGAILGAILGTAGSVIISTLLSIVLAPVWALIVAVVFFDLGGGSVGGTSSPAGGSAVQAA